MKGKEIECHPNININSEMNSFIDLFISFKPVLTGAFDVQDKKHKKIYFFSQCTGFAQLLQYVLHVAMSCCID